MLLRPHSLEVQRLPLGEIGQRRLNLLLLIIPALFIKGGKAREFDALVVSAEDILTAGSLNCHIVVDGAGHLRGGKSLPNKLIQPKLIPGEISLHPLRVKLHIARADGFVGILRGGFGFVAVSLCVCLTPSPQDIALGGGEGLL